MLKTLFSVSTVSNKGSIPGWETKITHVCSWPKNKVVFFFFLKECKVSSFSYRGL